MADGDVLLVQRVAEGDEVAYRELVRRHAARLRHFALRLTRDAAEAEDIVQETFLRLWQRAHEYAPEARVTTYLHRITHNLAVDRLRARGRLEEFDEDNEVPTSAPQPELLDAKRRAASLEAALAALPERQSAAVQLVHLHGLTAAEACQVLSVSENALESLLSRGRRALKARLGLQLCADRGEHP